MGTEGVQRKSVCYARSGDVARAEEVVLTVSPADGVGYLVLERGGTWCTNTPHGGLKK